MNITVGGNQSHARESALVLPSLAVAGRCGMLSKCANPECPEVFRYLHEGKIFRLAPTPTVRTAAATLGLLLTERFWLCDPCSKEMTVVWDGARAKIVPLPNDVAAVLPLEASHKGPQSSSVQAARQRAASAAAETAEIECEEVL